MRLGAPGSPPSVDDLTAVEQLGRRGPAPGGPPRGLRCHRAAATGRTRRPPMLRNTTGDTATMRPSATAATASSSTRPPATVPVSTMGTSNLRTQLVEVVDLEGVAGDLAGRLERLARRARRSPTGRRAPASGSRRDPAAGTPSRASRRTRRRRRPRRRRRIRVGIRLGREPETGLRVVAGAAGPRCPPPDRRPPRGCRRR